MQVKNGRSAGECSAVVVQNRYFQVVGAAINVVERKLGRRARLAVRRPIHPELDLVAKVGAQRWRHLDANRNVAGIVMQGGVVGGTDDGDVVFNPAGGPLIAGTV